MRNKKLIVAFVLLAIATLVWHANSAEAEIVTQGLVSYWTFDSDDIEGTTAKDVVGDNDGTVEGAEVVEGKVGQALKFDGIDDHVVVPHSDDLSLVGGGLSIVAWINPSAPAGHQAIVTKGSRNEYFFKLHGSAKVEFGMPGVGGMRTETVLSADTWYHVAATSDGVTAKLYIDGVQDGEDGGGWGLDTNETDVHIGGWAGVDGNQFLGIIDEVAIYNRSLSSDEMLQNYATGLITTTVEPVGKLGLTWGEIKASR